MWRRCVLFVFSGFFVWQNPSFAVGEQDGRLFGVIKDQLSGSPLPGATVQVSGPRLIGGPHTTLTEEDGSYQFPSLPPGTYDVGLSYEGTKPLFRKVVIRQGEAFPLHISWSVETEQETKKIIVEQRNMIRPDTTETGTVLSAEQTGRIATSRRYQDITQQAAGVTGGGNPNMKGGLDAHNRYLVDGLDITDPVTNTFSANINFDSIESIEIQTGGSEAQYNSLGGIINLITFAGSNEWRVNASQFVYHQSFTVGKQFGTAAYQGNRPFLYVNPPPQSAFQTTAMVGGALIKNRLWVNLSFEYLHRESSLPIGSTLGIQTPALRSDRYLTRLKLTYAPRSSHRLTLSLSADPAFFHNVVQDNLRLGVAEDHQRQGGLFSIFQWDYFHGEKWNTNVQLGFQYATVDAGPEGHFGAVDTTAYRGAGRFSDKNEYYDPERPQHVNTDDGTYWYQGGPVSFDKRITIQFDPSISVRGKFLGIHDAKFGLQTRVTHHLYETFLPGGETYFDSGGGSGENGLCLPETGQTQGCHIRTTTEPFANRQTGFSIGAFVQDRWRMTPYLRLNPGLRIDYGRTTNSLGQEVSNLLGVGPRIGIILDLTQDGKTLLSAYYGRANEVLSLLTAGYADVSATSVRQKWNPEKRVFEDFQKTGGEDGYALDPRGIPPHADEFTLSLRRELVGNSIARIDYTYKRIGNIWDGIEINQIWDPTGTRVIDYVDGIPRQRLLFTRPDDNWRQYHGLDVVFDARPTEVWDLSFAYTLSFLFGPGGEQFGQVTGDYRNSPFYNPRMSVFFDGYLPEDRRHNLKLRLSFKSHGFLLGAFLNFQSGQPRTARFFNQSDGDFTSRRSPSGTAPGQVTNDISAITETRTPALFMTDLRIAYDLRALLKTVHLQFSVDLFNVFDLDAPTEMEMRDVPSYGQVAARQAPLRIQLGLQFQY